MAGDAVVGRPENSDISAFANSALFCYEYPVTLMMKAPKDSNYSIVGESEIVLQAYETSVDFLFAPPD